MPGKRCGVRVGRQAPASGSGTPIPSAGAPARLPVEHRSCGQLGVGGRHDPRAEPTPARVANAELSIRCAGRTASRGPSDGGCEFFHERKDIPGVPALGANGAYEARRARPGTGSAGRDDGGCGAVRGSLTGSNGFQSSSVGCNAGSRFVSALHARRCTHPQSTNQLGFGWLR